MLTRLERRGPDADGFVVTPGGAIFGHKRLSIFDPSPAGNQPMLTRDESLAVVFNGAIYNFPDLRSTLESQGATFNTGTDTEVLLYGYRAWGIDGLVERLKGMFAFGLWDNRDRLLYLVRDRLGVKPLAYAIDGNRLVFASTPEALAVGVGADELHPEAVADYLEWGFVPETKALMSGLSKLPPASILRWRSGSSTVRQYWEPPSPGTLNPSYEEAVERSELLLLEATSRRLKADVPVAALLSGGIDSALVCWAIAQHGGNLTAYTVAAPNEAEDESADAALTAREIGLPHQVLPIPTLTPDLISQLVEAYAEPFACASALGMLAISENISGNAKVVLTGDGGDDVFLGYPRHRYLFIAQKLAQKIPRSFGELWESKSRNWHGAPGPLRRGAHFADYAVGGLGAFLQARDGWQWYQGHDVLGPRLAQLEPESRTLPWSRESAARMLDEYLRYDRTHQFVSEYLTKVDGATMWHGLEARSPFLDQDLWNYVSGLPSSTRLNQLRLKSILRSIARRRLGARVASGQKRGFEVPVLRWLARDWRELLLDSFQGSRLAEAGWVDGKALMKVLESSVGDSHVPIQVWYLFVLERWLRARERVSRSVVA